MDHWPVLGEQSLWVQPLMLGHIEEIIIIIIIILSFKKKIIQDMANKM